jgi:5-methyltetrahydrofolate--homocysteine methyltransferase
MTGYGIRFIYTYCLNYNRKEELIMDNRQQLFDAICAGNPADTKIYVQALVDAGEKSENILNETMIPAMREMGNRFADNEVYIPELLLAANAVQTGVKLLEPLLAESNHQKLGKVAIGTVKGDIHDIGKNLVATMLGGAGYSVDDLGTNCDLQKFIKAAENGAKVILCSALLTTTMPYMKEVVDHFKKAGDNIKVIIGGAPVTQEFADSIDADGFGEDANMAVEVVDSFFKKAN